MPTASSERAGLAALLAACVLPAGCARQPPAPAPAPPPPPLTAWPQGFTPPLKITDQLTLRVPLQYERAAIHPGQTPPRAFIAQQSDRSEAQFDFFLPDFSGYTLQNYESDSDPGKVEVVYLHAGNPHEADTDAPGEYPPNMRRRALAGFLNPGDYQDRYGLRCYRERERSVRLTCFGRRDPAGEEIMLTTVQPPYAEDGPPQLQARYFSTRYGGVRIAWRMHAKNLPRWREIDAQIWRFIAAWKVPDPASGASPGP